MQITVDKVLRARGKMLRSKANGPAECLLTEMLQCLPTETVYVVVCWHEKRFKDIGSGAEELTLRREENRYAAHVHRSHECGRQ